MVSFGQLVLFSTDTGDAWLLDVADRLTAPLARDGDPESIHLEETDTSFAIGWKGHYRIEGPAFITSIKTRDGFEPSSDTPRRRSRKQVSFGNFKYIWLELGFLESAMVVVDSGSGFYILLRVNLENDQAAEQLVKRLLEVISRRFSDGKVTIDEKVFNAARIVPVPGTMNCKGSDVAAWPHRLARIIKRPQVLEVVPRESLEEFVTEHAPSENG